MTLVAETAAALVIGNELLSGKTQESNLIELARLLRPIGVRLVRAVIVPDDTELIASEVRALSRDTGVVFTSGGVGPTHDDVTIEAVARAFGVDVVLDPYLERLVRERYAERVTEAHLRMALVPRGAELVGVSDAKWPATLIRNVFVLPGVPEIFRMKLDAVRTHLRGTQPFASRAAFVAIEEAELKPLLDAIVAAHPGVEVGSYPKWLEPSYKTKITFDAQDANAVEAALLDFTARVGKVVRVE
jgi:molybdenum cofactor synthesis domain-containing protein